MPKKKRARPQKKETAGWLRFLDGQRAYLDGKPCPERPSDETCHSNEAGYYYGWMLARSRDVMRIIDVLKMVGLHGTKQGDKLIGKLCDHLDKQRGFERVK